MAVARRPLARIAPPAPAIISTSRARVGDRDGERGTCPCCCDRGAGEAYRLARPPRPFRKKKSAAARSKARPGFAAALGSASRAREMHKEDERAPDGHCSDPSTFPQYPAIEMNDSDQGPQMDVGPPGAWHQRRGVGESEVARDRELAAPWRGSGALAAFR
jgi:hypothetical protein